MPVVSSVYSHFVGPRGYLSVYIILRSISIGMLVLRTSWGPGVLKKRGGVTNP